MRNPNSFRACCHSTVDVWEQAVYLEGELPCAFGELEAVDSNNPGPRTTVPLPLRRLISADIKDMVSVLVLQNIPSLTALKDKFAYSSSLKEAVFQDLPNLTEA